ncbi:MAG TPA: response regulator [Spirochaetota bacterium]|nr:response regulator [Spirochaetota bacterium]
MSKSYAFKKILIIDDDEIFLRPLIKFLTLMKFQVNIANSGVKGVELYGEIKFDLVITDLKMEEMNGIEVVNLITKNYPQSKIIVISGFLNSDEFQEIKNNPHVVTIFEKPLDYEVLLEKIKEII